MLYDAHVQRMKESLEGKSEKEFRSEKIQILAELTRLRQICCDPGLLFEGYKGESAKAQMCMELIENAVSAGHKVLLFSQFTSMLERLAAGLKKAGIDYYMLTGSVGKEKRMQMVESFNEDDVPVFCISLKAGGTGLNLTAADIVIHYDPWWNVAVQNQATDRAHRHRAEACRDGLQAGIRGNDRGEDHCDPGAQKRTGKTGARGGGNGFRFLYQGGNSRTSGIKRLFF